MALHRLIHRLDYPFNEVICDRPGHLIQVIMNVGGERYPEVKDSAPSRNLSAEGEAQDGTKWRVQLNPLNAVVSFEWKEPRSLPNLLKDPDVKVAYDVIDEVLRIAKIDEVARAGFRTFSYTNLDQGDVLKHCIGKMDQGLVTTVSENGGEISDICFVFEGEGQDKIHYTARVGPYFSREQQKYFDLLKGVEIDRLDSCNFIVDLDLSESNFRIKGKGSYGWSRSLQDRADVLIKSLQQTGRS